MNYCTYSFSFQDDEHIMNKHKYEELVQKLKWANGNGKGQRWEFDDIKKMARIDFSDVDYTEFDFAYLVNMLHAKCCKEITDLSSYIKLAKCLLEDKDEETKMYRGAYSNNKMRNKRGSQAYYNSYDDNYGYDEENRRRGRYRNERMDDYENRYYNDNGYENRRHYNNSEQNRSFFRQD